MTRRQRAGVGAAFRAAIARTRRAAGRAARAPSAIRRLAVSDAPIDAARRLMVRNHLSLRRVTGPGPEVSLTTHGARIARAHVAIESIVRGDLRPRKLTLWLDDAAVAERPPAALRRLRRRGLTIAASGGGLGPHTKYAAHVLGSAPFTAPLVTADDDVMYPRYWLAELDAAQRRHPERICCFRARRIIAQGEGFAPYGTWQFAHTDEPSFANFATGVSGVSYPPAFLERLATLGTQFLQVAPKADDVWINAAAVRFGFPVQQVRRMSEEYPTVPGTQEAALLQYNVDAGGNDAQIRDAYGPSDVARVRDALLAGTAGDRA